MEMLMARAEQERSALDRELRAMRSTASEASSHLRMARGGAAGEPLLVTSSIHIITLYFNQKEPERARRRPPAAQSCIWSPCVAACPCHVIKAYTSSFGAVRMCIMQSQQGRRSCKPVTTLSQQALCLT